MQHIGSLLPNLTNSSGMPEIHGNEAIVPCLKCDFPIPLVSSLLCTGPGGLVHDCPICQSEDLSSDTPMVEHKCGRRFCLEDIQCLLADRCTTTDVEDMVVRCPLCRDLLTRPLTDYEQEQRTLYQIRQSLRTRPKPKRHVVVSSTHSLLEEGLRLARQHDPSPALSEYFECLHPTIHSLITRMEAHALFFADEGAFISTEDLIRGADSFGLTAQDRDTVLVLSKTLAVSSWHLIHLNHPRDICFVVPMKFNFVVLRNLKQVRRIYPEVYHSLMQRGSSVQPTPIEPLTLRWLVRAYQQKPSISDLEDVVDTIDAPSQPGDSSYYVLFCAGTDEVSTMPRTVYAIRWPGQAVNERGGLLPRKLGWRVACLEASGWGSQSALGYRALGQRLHTEAKGQLDTDEELEEWRYWGMYCS